MEMQIVGSHATSIEKDDIGTPQVQLARERVKYEFIILAYRMLAIVVGAIMMVVGYLLFSSLVIDTENAQYYYQEITRVAPGSFFTVIGLIFTILGLTKLMPLPKFEKPNLENDKEQKKMATDKIPVLHPLQLPRWNDKLWCNNVKPLIEKVANNEPVSTSDRELLRNWLRTV